MTLIIKFGKKGGIPDLIYFIPAIMIIIFVGVIGWKVMKAVDDSFTQNNLLSSEGQSMMTSIRNRYVSIIDNAFLISFVGLIIAIGIGAYLINTHPALFWISIPIFLFIIFLSAIFSNTFSSIFSSGNLATEFADFNIIKFVLNNFVYFMTGIILLVMLLLFAKQRGQQQEF